eukprot:TsM_000021900 transcript=TsM_000021900 gene=TsM_000021900
MANPKSYDEDPVSDHEETVVTKKKKKGFVGFLINNWFMITTILGVIIGFGAGFGIQKVGLDETGKTWLAMPGTIYIRMLKLTILPMIAANIINGQWYCPRLHSRLQPSECTYWRCLFVHHQSRWVRRNVKTDYFVLQHLLHYPNLTDFHVTPTVKILHNFAFIAS